MGVEAVLRLTGAFRVFAKLGIWHEDKGLRGFYNVGTGGCVTNMYHNSVNFELKSLIYSKVLPFFFFQQTNND